MLTPSLRPSCSAAVIALSLAGASCGEEQSKVTEILVTVDADPEVAAALKRLRVAVYAGNTKRERSVVHEHVFTLPGDGRGTAEQTTLPFSFAVEHGGGTRFKLVVEGFDSNDERIAPKIEQKVVAAFRTGYTEALDVYLARSCYAAPHRCTDLESTCLPAARACAAVPEAALRIVKAGDELAGRSKASATPKPVGACAAANVCASPEYPCLAGTGDSYTCLGQFADWPMPSRASSTPPDYDYDSDPRLTVDRVTKLVWERTPPSRYPGCRDVNSMGESVCTWDEAKIYCSQLTLAGRSWRLPSRIEVESILDDGATSPNIDLAAFPYTPQNAMWTSSPNTQTLAEPTTKFWAIDFLGVQHFSQPPSTTFGVRCVSGGVVPSGKPEQRYEPVGSDAVFDTRTRLIWTKHPSPAIDTLTEAATYCTGLGGGYRLPATKELLSLVDPLRYEPAIDPIFDDTASTWFWARSQGRDNNAGVRPVWFGFGVATTQEVIDANPKTDLGQRYVRCVRAAKP